MKLKVVSNGLPKGTQIINGDTGEVLEGVSSINWHIDANSFAVLTVELKQVPVEVYVDQKHVRKTTRMIRPE